MDRYRTIIFTAAAATALLAGGCLLPPGGQPEQPEPEREPQPQIFLDIEEAEQVALYLDDDVRLDRFLMKRVFYDISLIRGAFRDWVEAVDYVYFHPPCTSDAVAIRFEERSYALVSSGSYEEWDQLNALYGPVSRQDEDDLRTVILFFDGLYDYRALAKEYSKLSGVLEATCILPVEDSPNIYARLATGGITYLFRDAWEGCETGCENNVFYYFVCENDDAVYVGSWDPDQRMYPPEWWDEARLNLPPGLADRFRPPGSTFGGTGR
jgi:hypothetical protein